jgi:hypothetical protein
MVQERGQCGDGYGQRSVGLIVGKMKKYYVESISEGTSYIK